MLKLFKTNLKAYVVLFTGLIAFAAPASATWYECSSKTSNTNFAFEESTSQVLQIYSPLYIRNVDTTLSGTFFMETADQKTYSADISEELDYPCNYQGAALQLSIKSEEAELNVLIKCDGAFSFKIHTEKLVCTVH